MSGLGAYSEDPTSATVEVAGPVATITRQVGAIGASAIGVYAVGRASVETPDNNYLDQYVENGFWESGYAEGDFDALTQPKVDRAPEVELPTVTLLTPAVAVTIGVVAEPLPVKALATEEPTVTVEADAFAEEQLPLLTVVSPETTSSGDAAAAYANLADTGTIAPYATAQVNQEIEVSLGTLALSAPDAVAVEKLIQTWVRPNATISIEYQITDYDTWDISAALASLPTDYVKRWVVKTNPIQLNTQTILVVSIRQPAGGYQPPWSSTFTYKYILDYHYITNDNGTISIQRHPSLETNQYPGIEPIGGFGGNNFVLDVQNSKIVLPNATTTRFIEDSQFDSWDDTTFVVGTLQVFSAIDLMLPTFIESASTADEVDSIQSWYVSVPTKPTSTVYLLGNPAGRYVPAGIFQDANGLDPEEWRELVEVGAAFGDRQNIQEQVNNPDGTISYIADAPGAPYASETAWAIWLVRNTRSTAYQWEVLESPKISHGGGHPNGWDTSTSPSNRLLAFADSYETAKAIFDANVSPIAGNSGFLFANPEEEYRAAALEKTLDTGLLRIYRTSSSPSLPVDFYYDSQPTQILAPTVAVEAYVPFDNTATTEPFTTVTVTTVTNAVSTEAGVPLVSLTVESVTAEASGNALSAGSLPTVSLTTAEPTATGTASAAPEQFVETSITSVEASASVSVQAVAQLTVLTLTAQEAQASGGTGATAEAALPTLTTSTVEPSVAYDYSVGSFAFSNLRLFAPASYETVIEVPLPTPVVQLTVPSFDTTADANTSAAGATVSTITPQVSVNYSASVAAAVGSVTLAPPAAIINTSANAGASIPSASIGAPQAVVNAGASVEAPISFAQVTAPDASVAYDYTATADGAQISTTVFTAAAVTAKEVFLDLPQAITSAPEAVLSISSTASADAAQVYISAPIASAAASANSSVTVGTAYASPPTASVSSEAGVAVSTIAITAPQITTALGSDIGVDLPQASVLAAEVAAAGTAIASAGLPDIFISPVRGQTAVGETPEPTNVIYTVPPSVFAKGNTEATAEPSFTEVVTVTALSAEAFEINDALALPPGAAVTVVVPVFQRSGSANADQQNDLIVAIVQDPGAVLGGVAVVTGDANTESGVGVITFSGLSGRGQLDVDRQVSFGKLLFTSSVQTEASGTATAKSVVQVNPSAQTPEVEATGGANAAAHFNQLNVTALNATVIINVSPETPLRPYLLETEVNQRPAVVNTNPAGVWRATVETTDISRGKYFDIPNLQFLGSFANSNAEWQSLGTYARDDLANLLPLSPENDPTSPQPLENQYVLKIGHDFTGATSDGTRRIRRHVELWKIGFDFSTQTPVVEMVDYMVRSSAASDSVSTVSSAMFSGEYVAAIHRSKANGNSIPAVYTVMSFRADLANERIIFHNQTSWSEFDDRGTVVPSAYVSGTSWSAAISTTRDRVDMRVQARIYTYSTGSINSTSSYYALTVRATGSITASTTPSFGSNLAQYGVYPLRTRTALYQERNNSTFFGTGPGANIYTPLPSTAFMAAASALGPDQIEIIAPRPLGAEDRPVVVDLPTLAVSQILSVGAGITEFPVPFFKQLDVIAAQGRRDIDNNVAPLGAIQPQIMAPFVIAQGGTSAAAVPALRVIAPEVAVSIETPVSLEPLNVVSADTKFAADGNAEAIAINQLEITSVVEADAGTFVFIGDLPTITVNPEVRTLTVIADIGTITEAPVATNDATAREQLTLNVVAAEPGISLSQSSEVEVEYDLEIIAPNVFAFQAQAIPDFVILVENETRFIEVAEEIRTSEVTAETRIIEVA